MARRWLEHRSLAGQILALQLLLFALVLTGVGAVSISQSREAAGDAQERRVRQVAEYVASLPLVRRQLEDLVAGTAGPDPLTTTAEQLRTTSDVADVLVSGTGDRVVASPADPRLTGTTLPPSPAGDPDDPSWLGDVDLGTRPVVAARVPVLTTGDGSFPPGRIIGGVLVAEPDRPWAADVRAGLPDLGTFLGISALVGLLGAWLLSRRVKAQTLGLEPAEIAALATHREAVLRGIREGVLALDPDGVVTVANDAARDLLALPTDVVGRHVDSLGLAPEVVSVLTRDPAPSDRAVSTGERVVVLSRTQMRRTTSAGSEVLGTVTTMRDRTELVGLRHALDVSRTATQALRAQTHEFANRLHTISGLVQLGRYDDVVGFIDRVSDGHALLGEQVSSRVGDPALAALLVALTSSADERDVDLVVADATSLPQVDASLSEDLVTVVGNLVDNAIDASADEGGVVEVEVRGTDGGAVVVVRDSGPGVDPARLRELVRRGTTTKDDGGAPGGRGVGLALVDLVCRRRSGSLAVEHADGGGAVFTAVLPAVPASAAVPATTGGDRA